MKTVYQRDYKDIALGAKFINSLGITKISQKIGLTPQAVYQWKKCGIPQPWKLYLQKEYSEQYKLFFG